MLKKLSVAAMVAAMSFATVPAMVSVAHAQDANEPPTAPAPSDAMKGGDMSKGDMSKGDMSKGSMSKGSMSKSGGMKKMKKKHMKKMKHM